MKPLPPPDTHFLQSAVGWVELGNPSEANDELEKIDPALRAHPDVLEVRVRIFMHAKKWLECVDLTQAIIKLDPDRADAWIHRSLALHELKRSGEAFGQLLPAAQKFPRVWTIPYNLACYCAQMGRLEECKKWFEKAMKIDERTVRAAAIDDPDLEPLWRSFDSRTP